MSRIVVKHGQALQALLYQALHNGSRFRAPIGDYPQRHARLAAIYDLLDPDRADLHAYLDLVEQVAAKRVLDIGCGTGVFALLLADRGVDVVGVDPARASLEVANAKPGGDRVRWICGDATALPPLRVDLVAMTANVAQAIVAPDAWRQTLTRAREALPSGGYLVFETRARPHVGQHLTSESTLRFRERDEVEADLTALGYRVREIRDAPDRPGKQFVFVARRA